MDDDEHTPAVTPAARRTTSIAISLVDIVAADVVSWAELVFTAAVEDARSSKDGLSKLGPVSLPDLPEPLRERNAQRLAATVRKAAATERAECDRLRQENLELKDELFRMRAMKRTDP